MPHLSDVCEPLRRHTDKDAVWTWLPKHNKALETVKNLPLVTHHPVLTYYDVKEPVTIQCDASENDLGATLLQEGQPVAFAFRSLSPAEQQYAQIKKER